MSGEAVKKQWCMVLSKTQKVQLVIGPEVPCLAVISPKTHLKIQTTQTLISKTYVSLLFVLD